MFPAPLRGQGGYETARLRSEPERASLHCANRSTDIAVASDDDDGHIAVGFDELLLEVDAIFDLELEPIVAAMRSRARARHLRARRCAADLR